MRSMKSLAAAFVVSSLASFGAGCAPAMDTAERFLEPLPVQEDVALRVPGSASTATGTQSSELRIATNGPSVGTARYYQFSRDLTDAVDFGTAVILGSIWSIVHTTPTELESKKAVWGPGSGSALEPAVWRFTVSEVGDAEYDYLLEGQLKTGGAWLSVMSGHGYGKSRAEHKQGWFKVDNDAYRALEPTRAKDVGSTKVTFSLANLPATIAVELRPNATPTKGWADVTVTHEEGGAGALRITGLDDVDDSNTTQLEDIHLTGRWMTNGSGRADVELKNGDLPFTVNVTECWSTSFARVFYKDTVDFEPESGSASVCAFPSAP